ncbi:PIF1-like helicase-domain-containing protein, partial [Staphylotrichum tortipilum]
MRVRGADLANRNFISWLQDLSYDPSFHGSIDPLPSFNLCYSEEDLIQRVYPPGLLALSGGDSTIFAGRALLSPRNTTVSSINSAVLAGLPGQSTRYLSHNEVENPPVDGDLNAPILSPDFLFSLDFPSIAPAILELKVGAPIMLLRNLDPREGLCNGT